MPGPGDRGGKKEKPKDAKGTLLRILNYLEKYKWIVALLFACAASFIACFTLLLTLLPYLCFGDVGRLSRRISPKDYSRGEWLMKLFGWLSIAAAIAVVSFVSW